MDSYHAQVAGRFNRSLYDIHIELTGVTMLEGSEVPRAKRTILAR